VLTLILVHHNENSILVLHPYKSGIAVDVDYANNASIFVMFHIAKAELRKKLNDKLQLIP
jgi:hypothetical protein